VEAVSEAVQVPVRRQQAAAAAEAPLLQQPAARLPLVERRQPLVQRVLPQVVLQHAVAALEAHAEPPLFLQSLPQMLDRNSRATPRPLSS
jgi:hypothetical protein